MSGVVTYTVRVDLGKSTSNAMPGMKGHIDLELKQSVLVVPSNTLQRNDTGAFVVVLANGKPARTPVVTGQVIADQTVIVSGLTEGQQVVIIDGTLPPLP